MIELKEGDPCPNCGRRCSDKYVARLVKQINDLNRRIAERGF